MKEQKSWAWERLESIPSTNEYIKTKRLDGKNLIVTAQSQTQGRGTKGRSFDSSKGGVYLSRLEFFDDFLSRDGFLIMVRAAVSVCNVISEFGLTPIIKWPNDIHVNGKKICGILIENTFSGDKIRNSIVGIGLNVNNVLPDSLTDIAITMQFALGKELDVDKVTERLVLELSKPHTIEKYQSYLGYMGREAQLLIGDELVPATLLSVDERGGLWVCIGKEERRLTAAEVQIKL